MRPRGVNFMLKGEGKMECSPVERCLVECEFFQGLSDEYLKTIGTLCEVREYEPGDVVFRQGDFGEHLYVIAEGQVYLERGVDLGDKKTGTVVISVLGKGRLLGCWSTLLGEPHILMCSAVTQKPSTILRFRGSELRGLMSDNSVLGFTLMERLCFLLKDRVQSAYGALEKI